MLVLYFLDTEYKILINFDITYANYLVHKSYDRIVF